MSKDGDIYEVPWTSERWDLAILRQRDIAFMGGPGRWVLYRPQHLLVMQEALDDRRVRGVLTRAKAARADDGEEAAIARALGLALLRVEEERAVRTVREVNERMPSSASLNHVPIAGPHRIGGDDEPGPAEDPGDVPGDGGAGEDVTVLVLDTGRVAATTKTLHIASGDDEVVDEDQDGLRDPAAGHGTHVSGIVARCAPGATIVAKRLLTTPVGVADDLHVAGALLDFHKDAHVINCSFSAQALDAQEPLALQQALARLPETTVVVAAAGNAGVSAPNWPAAFDGVVAVGAVGRPPGSHDWLQTDFSNHGSWVDCCAPGVKIVSTFLERPNEGFTTGFASWTGTSMACPAVAGTIAALATTGGTGIAPAASLPSRVAQAAAAVKALPAIGAVGAFVAPPS